MARKPGGKSRRRSTPEAPDVLVGIGVAMASYGSLQAMFSNLSADTGAAFVVVYSHTQGFVAETAAADLAQLSGMPASVCEEPTHPEPNHIYVAPNACILVSVDGQLIPEKPDDPGGKRGSIDSLMSSLAQNLGSRAIGVFLRGIAPDGIAGVKTLKEEGGLAIGEARGAALVQPTHDPVDPDGLMDFLLSPREIAERLSRHIERLRSTGATHDAANGEIQAGLSRVATILRSRTGHDFHGYKQNTFGRRVQRRMQVLQLETLDAYFSALRSDPQEADHLFQDLLIGVTQFFRDGPEFAFLEREIIPKLFEGKSANDTVRVWVLGCASGEEAYSIAILMREYMATLDVRPAVQIFATDLDGRPLSMARAGRYPQSIARDVTPERLDRWFAREGATYSVVKELREMCMFSQHNVIRDPPFSRIDLISCRNLLIYLTSELQERVIPLFHFSLKPSGYLFLGPSENVTRHNKLFAPVERRHRVFRRLEAATQTLPDFPLTTANSGTAGRAPRTPTPRTQVTPRTRKSVERIIERYGPTYVLVDEQFDVLQFSEHTGPYLEPAGGSASLNLLNLIRRELRLELRGALQTAAAERRRVEVDVGDVPINGVPRRQELIVEPISDAREATGFMVLFRDNGPAAASGPVGNAEAAALQDEHVRRLEAELRHSNERLQATIEELESTNEELKSSNEEYQSINEEMQSTNEELETSKEELQSVNEELHTVNGELGYRVSELARANSDLKNLLESTQIATIFLDNDLRVKSFTPSVSDIYHLIESDLGRPITDIASRMDYPELRDDVRRVLRTLTPVEREVVAESGETHYLIRVLPYRSIDNFIAGAVITFSEVSDIARAKAALSESEARYRLVVESATDYAIITMDEARRITAWNPGARHIFGWSEDEMIGASADEIFTSEDRARDAPDTEALQAADDGRAADNRWHLRRDGSRFWASGVMMPLKPPLKGFLKILHDRTAERENEERQRLLMAELQHRVKNILAVVRSIASRTLENADELDSFAAHFDGRLQALARAQNVLTRTGTRRIDLEELVSEELLTHGPHDEDHVTIEGPQIDLKDRAAEIFALALHELATNAVKYGALAAARGHVAVTWRILRAAGGRRLSLEWRETNVPALNPFPTRHGFGRDLIERGLPYELGAATSLEFLPGGVRCTIELPIDAEGEADSGFLQESAER